MSKPIKNLIVADYRKRFADIEGAVVIDVRGIDANTTNDLRLSLREKSIRVTVVKNSLARSAIGGTPLASLAPVLEGPSALAYGASELAGAASVVDVAREIVEWARKIKDMQLKGAVLDGVLYSGPEGVKRLSQFPTRAEAQAKVVQLVLSPGRNITGAAKGPGGRILGIIKEIQDRLEKGQTIAKAS
jgi:large subunit ribosomal protein L10